MKTRDNGLVTAGIGVGGFATLSFAAWVAFRLIIRQQVAAEMEKEGLSEYFFKGGAAASLIGVDLNLPSATELARSIVPMWSTIMPEEAIRNIGMYGRQSKYWPAEYRQPSPLAALGFEDAAFAELLAEVDRFAQRMG